MKTPLSLLFIFIAVLLSPAGTEGLTSNPDLEKEVLEKFGKKALGVYQRLDGTQPALEIMKKQGIDERKSKEIYQWFKEKAKLLNTQSVEYYTSATPEKALPYAEQALEITEKILGKNHLAVAKSLNYIAELYKLAGKNAEVESLYRRTLKLYENAYGREHPSVANALLNLAQVYTSTGRRREVERLYKEALEIFKSAYGREHSSVAAVTNNLALLYDSTGKLSEAEPLYREAIAIYEKIYGRNHPSVASGLNNLGLLYYSSGKYAEAEPLYRRALEIYKKAYGKHPAVATAMNNLALLYTSTGMYDKAETFFKGALKIDEELYGKEHSNIMSDLNNLAALYKDTNRLFEAEPLYRRALEIGERTLGRDHPAMAVGYNNLALLYYRTGKLKKAEPLYRKALEIGRKTLGEEHPDVAAWLNNIAMLYASEGKYLKSYESFTKAIAIEHGKKEDVFTFLPEDQKLFYMKRTEGSMHAFLSLSARHLHQSRAVVSNALDAWLRWKGAVMETQQRYMDAIAQSGDPRIKAKFSKLTSTKQKLARLKLQGPAEMGLIAYKKILRTLETQKQDIETELSRLSKPFALEKTSGKATALKIASLLPEDSIYVDYANIRAYDFRNRSTADFRYVAFILLPGEKPEVKLIDLGESAEINKHINAYLEEIRSPVIFGTLPRPKILKQDAAELYRLLIGPFAIYLKGKKQLFISPEGNLNLIPFEVLMSPKGKYLMEDHQINYITAGRDIVRFTDKATAKNTAVIMADPDYDLRLAHSLKESLKEPQGGISKDVFGMRFPRLPDTTEEANEIEKILKGENYRVQTYKGSKATEETLFRVESPKTLHLATHGYFLKDLRSEGDVDQSMGFLLLNSKKSMPLENPMLRSGIVLAGANISLKEGRDNGIVSADKALALKLRGTELVVLSACDTGVGDVERGEGVFGLRRAFILAGAKTLVMSLWSVPSRETRELMTEFYKLMAEGRSKAEALRLARLKLMHKYENPFFWGAFVMVGNPQ